ncbi:PTS system%2C fructose-specific IIA component/PTS system%2C fructose-specific IIB component/PTS system%2C fructose-specific IIC component [Vibrio cholerae]|nr:PTS system%2C fructose-specific IIA component/PTS system%2C fructose-specific IIB component/PTS system%2C fructose-specific IIC component [Vibrio cholerae]
MPAVVVGISRQGIDYGAEDGQLSDVFSKPQKVLSRHSPFLFTHSTQH